MCLKEVNVIISTKEREKMKRKTKLLLLTLAAFLIIFILIFFAKKGFSVGCLFNYITDLKCAGCGNTRAALALLELDFKEMLNYNLFFPLEVAYIVKVYITCAKNYLKTGKFVYSVKPDFIDIAFLALLLLWTVVRNVF